MKKILVLLLLALSFVRGADYPFEETVTYDLSVSPNLNSAGVINELVSAIADQLSQNKDFLNNKTPIAITSIVDLEDFKKSSKFGNVISENLIHEMQVRGFSVVDYKTMPNIEITKDGDYIFSRVVKELDKNHNINLVLSGTFTQYKDGYAINCRIIDIADHIVKSSAQIFVPKELVSKLEPTKIIFKYKNIDTLVYPAVKKNQVLLK